MPSSSFESSASANAEDTRQTIESALTSVQDVFENARDCVRSEVEEHPTRTLLIASGLGIAVGALWAMNKYSASSSFDWSRLPRQYADALRHLRLPG
jgi:hypothetical protein